MISKLLLILALALASWAPASAQVTTPPQLGGKSGVPTAGFYAQPHAWNGRNSQPLCTLIDAPTVLSDAVDCPTSRVASPSYNELVVSTVRSPATILARPTRLNPLGGDVIIFKITHAGSNDIVLQPGGFRTSGGVQPTSWATAVAGQIDYLTCIGLPGGTVMDCPSLTTGLSLVNPITIVQTVTLGCPTGGSGDGTGGTTCPTSTLTLTSGNDLIIAVVNCTTTGCSGTGTTAVVTGIAGTNLGSCAVLTNSAAAALIKTELWRCHITGSGSTSGTVTWGATAFYGDTQSWEVSGLASSPDDGVGATATGTGVTPTAALTGGGATQGDGEMIVVAQFCNLGPFTLSGAGWVDDDAAGFGHKFTIATGAQTPTLTCSANTGANPWGTSIAALKHK